MVTAFGGSTLLSGMQALSSVESFGGACRLKTEFSMFSTLGGLTKNRRIRTKTEEPRTKKMIVRIRADRYVNQSMPCVVNPSRSARERCTAQIATRQHMRQEKSAESLDARNEDLGRLGKKRIRERISLLPRFVPRSLI